MDTEYRCTAIVGETGNEHGHVMYHGDDMSEAVRIAIDECAMYNGDGWWSVRYGGLQVEHGGQS